MRLPRGDWKCPEEYIYMHFLENLFVKNIEILRPTLITHVIVEIHIFRNVGRVFFHWTPS